MSERDELDEAIERYRICDIEKCLACPVDENAWSTLGPILLDETYPRDAALFRKDPAETRRRCSQRQHSSEAFELLREVIEEFPAITLRQIDLCTRIDQLLLDIESET